MQKLKKLTGLLVLKLTGLLVFTGLFCCAQVDTGLIAGKLRDGSGSVVKGGKVRITNQKTGISQELTSDNNGTYISAPLRPGDYQIDVEMTGFDKSAKETHLDLSETAIINFELSIGKLNQVVEVVEATPVLQTETGTLSNLRDEKAVKDLPLNGRNFAQLVGLAPGAMPAQSQLGGVPITAKRGVIAYSVNGLRYADNAFLVDGINNNENHNGQGIMIFPPLDAVEEFRVESSVANAQFGHGSGGTVNLTYKTGTRDFHGSLFEFVRNSAFDAKNFFDNPGQPIPDFRQNQFGGTLGGRLLPWQSEPKTFFFFDYEGQRVRQQQTYISSVPSTAFRSGDFSAAAQKIFDPASTRSNGAGGYLRDPFAGNIIPANRIDKVGANILALYPSPNLGSGIANNYLSNPRRTTNADAIDAKIDHNFRDKDAMFVRYSQSSDDLLEPSFLPAPAVGNGPGTSGLANQPVHQAVLSETHTFSSNRINEVRFGFTRLNLRALNPNYGVNVASQIGIPGANTSDVLTSGLPIINTSGLRDLGDSGFSPAIIVSQNAQLIDNFTYLHGKHTFKFGGDILRKQYNAFQSNTLHGSMQFSTIYSSNPSAGNTGIGAADVLLGKPATGSIRYLTGTRGFRRTELAFFAQDDYKITDRLTLNLGVRYENYLGNPWTEVNNRMYQWIPSAQTVQQVGSNGIPASGVNGDNNNFAPRVGLAYRVLPKTVFRAAYGIFYVSPQFDITRNLAANPPEFISTAFTNNQFDFAGARAASQGFDRPSSSVIAGASLNAVDPNLRTTYSQQWNAAIERQLPGSIAFTVAYVGTKGTKLEVQGNENQPVPGTSPIAQRRPFPAFQSILLSENRESSIYHGLQISAERRFSNGLSFLASYTYSHAIDEASANYSSPMDYRNFRRDRGNSDYDVRHRATASFSYALPIKPENALLKYALGGWQLNGIVSLYGGLPFSVQSSSNTLNIGSGTRADRVCQGTLSQPTLQAWFDTSCFKAPGPQLFGNGGRNILNGPGTAQVDSSIFKDFPFGKEGKRRAQFRAEAFNLFNTPQFNNPANSVGAAGAGTINSAGSILTLQRTSRQIQLAMKLYF